MKKAKKEGAYCTTREAAKLLGVSLRTVQLWSQSGALKCWKTAGGHRRIPREAVDSMIAEWRSAEEQPRKVKSGKREFHVLIMDDDIDLLHLYRLQLSSWIPSIKVTTVPNGFEALIKIGITIPDILIADLKMPGIDGFEVLRILRRIPEMDKLTIVVISALSAKEIERRGGIKSGINFLPKPVPFPALREIIDAAMAKV